MLRLTVIVGSMRFIFHFSWNSCVISVGLLCHCPHWPLASAVPSPFCHITFDCLEWTGSRALTVTVPCRNMWIFIHAIMWEMWWEMCDLWLVCSSVHTRAGLRWMATTGPFRAVALSVEEWGFLTPTIAKSAHSRRKTGMVVQKLSTRGALRQICFTNVKNMVSRKDDS